MIWTVMGVVVGFVIAHAIYCVGYVRGYKAGADYGMSKLDEYHQYTMAAMNGLRDAENEQGQRAT